MQIDHQKQKFILASNNKHKVKEIKTILEPFGISLLLLSDYPEIPDPPETGDSFSDNALEKARYVYNWTQLPTIADDSGLSVDALDGAPGVHSKRYTPEATAEANNSKLLQALKGVSKRGAHFTCAIAIVSDKKEHVLMGKCHGVIAMQPIGEKGFGYDPLFIPDAFPDRHMAELTESEKNTISHRGFALEGLIPALRTLGLL
jgi:XTP/dITP diphosphohydrolase